MQNPWKEEKGWMWHRFLDKKKRYHYPMKYAFCILEWSKNKRRLDVRQSKFKRLVSVNIFKTFNENILLKRSMRGSWRPYYNHHRRVMLQKIELWDNKIMSVSLWSVSGLVLILSIYVCIIGLKMLCCFVCLFVCLFVCFFKIREEYNLKKSKHKKTKQSRKRRNEMWDY